MRVTSESASPSRTSGIGDSLLDGALIAGPRADLMSALVAQQLQRSTESGLLLPQMRLIQRNLEGERPDVFADFVLKGFGRSDGGPMRASSEQVSESLRSEQFIEGLDRLRWQLDLDRTAAITVSGLVTGLPLIYALWLIRSGLLLGSYLSAVPAWRLLDPLPVLGRANDDEENEDDEPLPSILLNSPDPLRGFA
ncbi:MAG: hypothetical protein NVS2B4_01250 [Ramlibacter sp.]